MRRGQRDTIRRMPDYERDPEWDAGVLFGKKKKLARKAPAPGEQKDVFIEEPEEDRDPDS